MVPTGQPAARLVHLVSDVGDSGVHHRGHVCGGENRWIPRRISSRISSGRSGLLTSRTLEIVMTNGNDHVHYSIEFHRSGGLRHGGGHMVMTTRPISPPTELAVIRSSSALVHSQGQVVVGAPLIAVRQGQLREPKGRLGLFQRRAWSVLPHGGPRPRPIRLPWPRWSAGVRGFRVHRLEGSAGR